MYALVRFQQELLPLSHLYQAGRGNASEEREYRVVHLLNYKLPNSTDHQRYSFPI